MAYSPFGLLLGAMMLGRTGAQVFAQPLLVACDGQQVLIRLSGFDDSGAQRLTASVSGTSGLSGTLSQLSKVFSTYGYEPKAGSVIVNNNTVVSGSLNRVLYTPSFGGNLNQVSRLDSFSYVVSNGTASSLPAAVVIVSASTGGIVGFDFNGGSSQGWEVYGNPVLTEAVFEPSSRGPLMNYYILGSDDDINLNSAGTADLSLWYFQAPSSSLAGLNLAYKGHLRFDMSSLAGDFSRLNPSSTNVVMLECDQCHGPSAPGLTLGFPIEALTLSFNGSATSFDLVLDETSGWLKDPQDALLQWSTPSQCDMINVLSGLSELRILGDWTVWYETIALDNVVIYNTKCTLYFSYCVRIR